MNWNEASRHGLTRAGFRGGPEVAEEDEQGLYALLDAITGTIGLFGHTVAFKLQEAQLSWVRADGGEGPAGDGTPAANVNVYWIHAWAACCGQGALFMCTGQSRLSDILLPARLMAPCKDAGRRYG